MCESNNVIVTGFGPFKAHSVNASWEAVKLLPDEYEGINIIKREIPVEYDEVSSVIPKLWEEFKPLLVVHVGVSGDSRVITLEQCANRDGYDQCDARGNKHATGSVCASGLECIFTGINIKDICHKLNNFGTVKTCASQNAGKYLCEFIYYTSLNIDSSKTLFLHVPPLDLPYSAKELAVGLLDIIYCALNQQICQNEDIIENAM